MNRVAGSEAMVLSTVRQEMERLSREVLFCFLPLKIAPLTLN